MRNLRMGRSGWLLLALFTLVALGAACSQIEQLGEKVGGTSAPLTVADVVADPERYVGKTVSLDGGVARVLGEGVLALESDAADRPLLAVIGNSALLGIDAIAPGELLHLVGTVQALTRDDLVRASNDVGIKLDTDALLDLGGSGPFIVVQAVAKAQ